MKKILSILILVLLWPGLIFAVPNKVHEIQPQQMQTPMQVKKRLENSVDINTADEAALMTLKGISRKKAKAIIVYRKKHDAFTSVADLAKVRGFSKKRADKIMEMNKGRIRFERKINDQRSGGNSVK